MLVHIGHEKSRWKQRKLSAAELSFFLRTGAGWATSVIEAKV